jgi:hypothetical protein
VRSKHPNTDAWFSVKEPVRDFPVGRSSEIVVQISVPAEAGKGMIEFELDIVREGVEPLEDRTDRGQEATFEVHEIAKPFPWWIVAAGAAALLVIIGLVIFLTTRPVAVPDLVQMDATQAAKALSAAGLAQGTVMSAPNDSIGAGLVAGSTPGAKTPLPRSGLVNLVFSEGKPMATVPAFTGQTLEQAKTALAGAGLTVGSITQAFDPAIPNGQVISSNPPSGQSLPPGTPVTLLVSKGPPPPTLAPATITPTSKPPTATLTIKSLDRAPSEDTFAYPSRYVCYTILPWIIPMPIIPIAPVSPVSYHPAPAVTLEAPLPIFKLTVMAPVFKVTLEPLLIKCADSKSPELVVENDLAGGTFYPGVAVMRFDFGSDVPAGAVLTAANLKLYAASLGSGTSSMSLYISAATNEWKENGTGPVCSGEHSAALTVNGAGQFNFDLKPLLATNSANILKNGLCIQSNSIGLVNLVSSEGGIATQRPLLSITYQK